MKQQIKTILLAAVLAAALCACGKEPPTAAAIQADLEQQPLVTEQSVADYEETYGVKSVADLRHEEGKNSDTAQCVLTLESEHYRITGSVRLQYTYDGNTWLLTDCGELTRESVEPLSGIPDETAAAYAQTIYSDAVLTDHETDLKNATDTVDFASGMVGTNFDRTASLTVTFRFDAEAGEWKAAERHAEYDLDLHPIRSVYDCGGNGVKTAQTLLEFLDIWPNNRAQVHTMHYDPAQERAWQLTDSVALRPDEFGLNLAFTLDGVTYAIQQESILRMDDDATGHVLSKLSEPYEVAWLARYLPGAVLDVDYTVSEEPEPTPAPVLWRTERTAYARDGAVSARTEAYFRRNGETLMVRYYSGTDQDYGSSYLYRYTYDEDGRVRSEDGSAKTTWAYQDGRAVQETITSGTGTMTRTYTYDAQGRRSRMLNQDGTWRQYTYDAAGNLTAELGYDAENTPVSRIDYTYGEQGRLILRTDTVGSKKQGTVTYTYDADGRLSATDEYTAREVRTAHTDYQYR